MESKEELTSHVFSIVNLSGFDTWKQKDGLYHMLIVIFKIGQIIL